MEEEQNRHFSEDIVNRYSEQANEKCLSPLIREAPNKTISRYHLKPVKVAHIEKKKKKKPSVLAEVQ